MSEASRAYEEWRALEERQELSEEEEERRRIAIARFIIVANIYYGLDLPMSFNA